MIGETIGKYRIVARLGRGGMGTVYKAVDQTLEREVAIKVLNPGLAQSDVLKRFRAEAVTLAKLNHPNIATLYELGQHGDELLMVMEFVRGETFDKLSERVGPMPFERAAYLTAQVLDALAHAHRAGVVHRDLKPANLMLSESGVVKVMDFGIARMVGTEHLTSDGLMMGTPAYMAPEQVMGTEVDGRADLYGVGVILFRMLTSHLPFKADTAVAMVQKQVKDAPTPLRQFRAELPAWCEQIMDRALAKPPEARYQTADEFRSALMLSAALAPATEVTSVLASGMSPDPEITIAPDSMPTTRLSSRPVPPPGARTPAPAQPASAPKSAPPESAAPTVAAPLTTRPPASAPVFIPISEPVTAGFRAANPSAPPPPGQARASTLAYAGLAIAFLAAVIAAVVVLTVKRPSMSDTPATPPSSAPEVSQAPASVPPAASLPPAASAEPSVTTPAATPAAAATAPRRGTSDPLESPAAPSGSKPPSAAAAPSAARGPARESRPALPSMTFEPVRHLVISGTRPSEREASLRLGSDALVLSGQDGGGASKTVPYPSVIAIFHSRSREPQWTGPTGAALPIVKMDGGMFGFMRGDRDWVSVRTKAEFVMLRPEAGLVARVIDAIEARTGLTTVRVGKRGAGQD